MAASVAGDVDEPLESQMRACLHGPGGEVSARNRAAKLAQTYQGLDEAGRKHFLRTLALPGVGRMLAEQELELPSWADFSP